MKSRRLCFQLGMGSTLLGIFILSQARAQEINNPAISVILDGHYQTEDRLMGNEKGFGLGETEFSASGSIDDWFYGKFTSVLASHDGGTEIELEEAFIQTLAMPAGTSIRAGRFLSDIGYLNPQHMHTDAFINRPAVYRAFLGGHYFDDGVRVSWVAPTDIYWTVGTEAFTGEKLRDESPESDSTVGVYTAYTKLGGDLGVASSWQFGLSYLHNQNGRLGHHSPQQSHDHDHSALYTGKHLYGVDFVYKWAPQGNYKYRHFTLSTEYFRLTEFLPKEYQITPTQLPSHDYQQGWYVSGVYQLTPRWSAGLRYGQLATEERHVDLANSTLEFEEQRVKETDVVFTWHHSHFSQVRLQYSYLDNYGHEDYPTYDHIVSLQFVMTLGAHGAHQF